MSARTQLRKVPEAERTPLVDQLLALIEQLIQESIRQAEVIQHLRDKIAALKGEKGKPKFKASGMEPETEAVADADSKANPQTRSVQAQPSVARQRN